MFKTPGGDEESASWVDISRKQNQKRKVSDGIGMAGIKV